jgi:hypothetical protein
LASSDRRRSEAREAVRVHLIRPILVELRRLDTEVTKATGGYDPEFGAVRVDRRAGKRVTERKEKAPILLRGQWEDQTQNALRMFGAGNSPEAKVAVIFDYHDLLEAALVDPSSGLPLINVNDRLTSTYNPETRRKIMDIKAPGLFAVEVRPASIGLDGTIGIVVVRFNDRELSEAPA